MPYNPYNGNYYGDGSDVKRNSKGDAIANEKTGSSRNSYGEGVVTRDGGKSYGSAGGGGGYSAPSGSGSSGTGSQFKDKQVDNAKDYIEKAKNSGRSQSEIDSAIKYAQEQIRRVKAGEDLQYTWKYDGRGFGSSGNYGEAGREFSYDPFTGAVKGNTAMKDPNYNLMYDPRFNYGQGFYQEQYANSPWLKELESQGKLVDGETAQTLAPEYAKRWLSANQYKADNEYLTKPIILPAEQREQASKEMFGGKLSTGMPVNQNQVQAKLGGYDFGGQQAGNREYALQQIADAGRMYNEAKARGDQQGMAQAHAMANSIRSAYGISGDGRSTTGLEGTKYDPANMQTPEDVQAVAQEFSQMPQQQQVNMMQMINQEYVKLQQEIAQRASMEAKAVAKQKLDTLQSLVDQINAQRNQSLDLIKNSVADAEGQLKNDSFQAWLNARQGMANRGLAGSGIASDQDLRLMMSNNQQLAGIHRDALTRSAGVNQDFDSKLSEIYSKLGDVDPASIEGDLYRKYMDSEGKLLNDRMSQLMKMYEFSNVSATDLMKNQTEMGKALLPYQQMTANDYARLQFDQQKFNADRAWDQFQFGNISATDQAKLANQWNIAQGGWQNNLDTTGMNVQSRERIAQWNNSTQLQMNENTNATRLAQSQANIDMKIKELEYKKYDGTAKMLNDQAKSALTKANSIAQLLKADPENYELKMQYNQAINQASGLMNMAEQQAVGNSGNVNFTQAGEGGDVPKGKRYSGDWRKATPQTFTNYKRLSGGDAKSNPEGYKRATSSISSALQAKGYPSNWLMPLLELTARESSWNPTAQNPKSTAYGMFQFLDGTWKGYGTKTSDPYKQALAGVEYVKARYGDPWKALAFHDINNWY